MNAADIGFAREDENYAGGYPLRCDCGAAIHAIALRVADCLLTAADVWAVGGVRSNDAFAILYRLRELHKAGVQ